MHLSIYILSLIITALAIISFSIYFRGNNKLKKEKMIFTNRFLAQVIILAYIFFISMGFFKSRFIIPIISLMVASLIYLIFIIFHVISRIIKYILVKIKSGEKSKVKSEKEKLWILTIILSVLMAFQFIIASSSVRYYYNEELVEFQIAGNVLSNKVNPDDIILMHDYNYIYYIGECIPHKYPFGDKSLILSEIKSLNASYVIFSERIEVYPSHRPDLIFLLDPLDLEINEVMTPLFVYNVTNRKMVIYQVSS